MYGLHQSLEGGVKPKDNNSFKATLRELREETGLKIYYSRAKQIRNDGKFDCDIYIIELNIEKNSQQIEQDKIGPWGLYYRICTSIQQPAVANYRGASPVYVKGIRSLETSRV